MIRINCNEINIISYLKKIFFPPLILLCIFFILNFFSYRKTMECDYTSCTIYRVENSTKKTTMIDMFNESQIEYIEVRDYSTSSHSKYNRTSVNRRLYPVVYLRSGRKIVLDMINLPYNYDYPERNNIDFNYFRNKKF